MGVEASFCLIELKSLSKSVVPLVGVEGVSMVLAQATNRNLKTITGDRPMAQKL